MAVKVRTNPSRDASFLRLAYSAPAPRGSLGEEICRFAWPATKLLPFVKLRPNDQPLWRPQCYWHVESTGKRDKDLHLGRKYARQALAAMKADHNTNLIAYIIQDMVDGAPAQRKKPGARCANAIVRGFLAEISEAVAGVP